MINGGQILKKNAIQFLIISFVLGYLCFGILAISNSLFSEIFLNPLYLLLLIIGFLSPFISSLMVYILNKNELGGVHTFINDLRLILSNKSILLVILLVIAHYGFGIILKAVGAYGSIFNFFKYLPLMILFLGSQEIGWRRIVQPYYEGEKGFYRSVLITGLFWSLWFLPLIFIKGFIILPQFYLPFAGYLIGLSFLLTTIYRVTNQIAYSIILSSLIFALSPVIILKQGNILLGLAGLEFLIANILKDKKITLSR